MMHRLVEEEVGAAVGEDRQHLELLGHRAERRGVGAGNDAGEEVDLAVELHAPEFFDVGVGPGGLVCGDGLDLALAEEPALGVDLLGRHRVALQRRLAQHRGGAREKGHMADLEGRVGDLPLGGLRGRLDDPRAADQTGRRQSGAADRHAQTVEKTATTGGWCLLHEGSSLELSRCRCGNRRRRYHMICRNARSRLAGGGRLRGGRLSLICVKAIPIRTGRWL
jgi:hypothetical protein